MNQEILDFIDFAKDKTEEYGISFELRDVKYFRLVDEGYARCHGYFDEDGMALKCANAVHHSKWVPVLIHEYSHFEQWVEQCPEWTNSDFDEDYHGWVKGKVEITDRRKKIIMRKLISLELDCERRAHKNIKKYNLPLDRDLYAQCANAYIHFYNWTALRRKWYNVKKCPYRMREVTKHMPTTLKGDHFTTPKEYIELFDKHCV